jgi:hypothetical protein
MQLQNIQVTGTFNKQYENYNAKYYKTWISYNNVNQKPKQTSILKKSTCWSYKLLPLSPDSTVKQNTNVDLAINNRRAYRMTLHHCLQVFKQDTHSELGDQRNELGGLQVHTPITSRMLFNRRYTESLDRLKICYVRSHSINNIYLTTSFQSWIVLCKKRTHAVTI